MTAAPPPAGLVVVDKPAGMTSHDVVARVRRLAGTRKVGHAGTLDPMATGVLVIGINRATRLLGHLLLTDKAYEATVRLGASTSTDDAEGELLGSSSTDEVTEEAVRAGLAAMVGEIDQVPSAVSAIKVDGKRAYERVRAGEDAEDGAEVRDGAREYPVDRDELGREREVARADVAVTGEPPVARLERGHAAEADARPVTALVATVRPLCALRP